MKIRVNKSHRSPRGAFSITTKTQEVTVDLDPKPIAKAVAEAALAAIQSGIRSVTERAKSGQQKWNRTGRLASGLRVERSGDGYAVVPPDDRLNGDGLLDALHEDVKAARDPLGESRVQEALQDATRSLVKVDVIPRGVS